MMLVAVASLKLCELFMRAIKKTIDRSEGNYGWGDNVGFDSKYLFCVDLF